MRPERSDDDPRSYPPIEIWIPRVHVVVRGERLQIRWAFGSWVAITGSMITQTLVCLEGIFHLGRYAADASMGILKIAAVTGCGLLTLLGVMSGRAVFAIFVRGRRPLILDRRTGCDFGGDEPSIPLDQITAVGIAPEYDEDEEWTMYNVALHLAADKKGARRVWPFARRCDARRFAGTVAGFLGVEVIEFEKPKPNDALLASLDDPIVG